MKQTMKPREVRGAIRRANKVLIWTEFAEFPDGTVDGAWLEVPKTIALELTDIAENVASEEPDPNVPMTCFHCTDGSLAIGNGYDPDEVDNSEGDDESTDDDGEEEPDEGEEPEGESP